MQNLITLGHPFWEKCNRGRRNRKIKRKTTLRAACALRHSDQQTKVLNAMKLSSYCVAQVTPKKNQFPKRKRRRPIPNPKML
jgi:hypothetical protein